MRGAAGSDLAAPPVVLAAAVADAVAQVAAEVVVVAADAAGAVEEEVVDAVQVAAADAGPSTDNSLPSATGAGATRHNRPIPAPSP